MLFSTAPLNLSNHKLSTTEEAVLAKGPKYAVTPKTNPIDIAAPIEAALQLSSATDQDEELPGKNLRGGPESEETCDQHYSGGEESISRAEEKIVTSKFFTLTKGMIPLF